MSVVASRKPSPSSARLAALVACSAALGGCGHQQQKPPKPTRAKPEMNWHEQPLGGVAAGVAAPVAVKRGAAPLFYLAEAGETLRVVDHTNNRVLAEIDVQRGPLLRVGARPDVGGEHRSRLPEHQRRQPAFGMSVLPRGWRVPRPGSFRRARLRRVWPA